jgi:hypothetical protein
LVARPLKIVDHLQFNVLILYVLQQVYTIPSRSAEAAKSKLGGLDAGSSDPGHCWEWREDPTSQKFRE